MATQFITDEAGKRLGVVLDWTTYQRLVCVEIQDPELLPGVGAEELSILAYVSLASDLQQELSKLLEQNREGQMSESEAKRLDELLAQVDRLNILKARAKYTIEQLYAQSVA
ncbi:MAG: hypothetical protein HC771_04915 [Synechococcales cyanobacterium CRU_2_2]|nr:hypothetical protein [Synechococcales cyanobacterium CRU_2_2]